MVDDKLPNENEEEVVEDTSPTIENAIQEKDYDKLVKYVLEGKYQDGFLMEQNFLLHLNSYSKLTRRFYLLSQYSMTLFSYNIAKNIGLCTKTWWSNSS